ncbi:DUF3035 domain-containing protein [Paracoccus suum]|uniref:DUF3035 domain-containing protein n=1 Tax=Paracoccus suum TaxID=2259340 RepID=A0A344PIF7_9RHOB|nr:DUF3035 domain-containing protein [Paracoccus suum]AXC49162.1 DUF3035 domain-containing protein [Paracoccus suum]
MRLINLGFGCLAAVALLAGCSNDGKLNNLAGSSEGPDEFAILPTKALSLPADLNQLPAPTPGGSNITDPTPLADAVATLGGNPAQLSARGVGAGDGGLISYAGRGGVTPGIRQVTATEDAEFRSRRGRRLLENIAKTNVYNRAYRGQTLDPWPTLEQYRRAGAQVPSAPPAPLK